jgi:hypothetical protein
LRGADDHGWGGPGRISRNSVRQESFADLVSCKELTMGIARSP